MRDCTGNFTLTSQPLHNYFTTTSQLLHNHFTTTSSLLHHYFITTSQLLYNYFTNTSRATSQLLHNYFTNPVTRIFDLLHARRDGLRGAKNCRPTAIGLDRGNRDPTQSSCPRLPDAIRQLSNARGGPRWNSSVNVFIRAMETQL